MEVIVPASPRMDFDFASGRSTPDVLSAPSTPKRFGDYYFSAPTSPSRMADFYREFDEFSRNELAGRDDESSSPTVPFSWEEKPGKPKSPKGERNDDEHVDFAFDFCEDMEKASLSAEELFDGGKIRPLKPPPRLQLPDKYKEDVSRKSPVLTPTWQGRKAIAEGLSPRRRSKETGPFSKDATEKSRKDQPDQERGRGRAPGSGQRAARSLSPFRVSSYPWEEEEKEKEQRQNPNSSSKPPCSSNSSSISSKGAGSGSKKWRLKDFLLFRSASEGRATDKDPYRKYTSIFRTQDGIRNSSFRSTATDSHAGSISRRRSGTISAHELHYTINKAVSNDLKKKTFLPYKQGILARVFMP